MKRYVKDLEQNDPDSYEKYLTSRRSIVDHTIPPLAYAISDVIVYVHQGNNSDIAPYEALKEWAENARSMVVSARCPSLIIVRNRADRYESYKKVTKQNAAELEGYVTLLSSYFREITWFSIVDENASNLAPKLPRQIEYLKVLLINPPLIDHRINPLKKVILSSSARYTDTIPLNESLWYYIFLVVCTALRNKEKIFLSSIITEYCLGGNKEESVP
jgi:hypothetical protein